MQRTNVLSAAVASVVVGLAGSAVHGQFLIDTSFQAITPTAVGGTTYSWNEPTNWNNGLPTATSLAITSNIVNPAVSPAALYGQTVGSNLTMYGLRYQSTNALNLTVGSSAGVTLTLLSKDAAYDATLKTAPAIEAVNAGAQSEFSIAPAIQLGDATTTSGTAHFVNSLRNNGILIQNKVSEFAGQSWGITFGGTGNFETVARGLSNGGNYLVNRYAVTGKITVTSGGNVRTTNNVLPYGPGLQDYQIDGRFTRATNSGSVVANAIDGSGQLTRAAGNDLVVGANNGDGDFSGIINSTSIRLYKVGSGTQSLGGGANVNVQEFTWVADGAVSIDAASRLSTTSRVNTLDGGGIVYTGAGETTTRIVNTTFRGGSISSSGTGALVFDAASTFGVTGEARAIGDASQSGTNQVVSNGYGLTGLSNPAFAGKLVITGEQSAIVAGSTGFTVNEAARTIDLGAGNVVNAASAGVGAPRFTFTQNAAIDRALTLGGSNAGANTIAAVLADSASGKLGITKAGAGAWTLTAANTYTGTTTVAAGTLTTTYSDTGTSAASPLLTGAGGVDLTGGRLVLDHSASTSPITTVRALLAAGAPSNFASGQIRATTFAATPSRGIGYAELGGGLLAVQSTFYGDATLDGLVNVADLGALATNYGATNAVWAQGDFNYDAAVSVADLGLLATYYGSGTSLTAADAAAQFRLDLASVAASNPEFAAAMGIVPEPTSLAVLAGAALTIGSRRRRRTISVA